MTPLSTHRLSARAAGWALALGCAAVILGMRLAPLGLPVADKLAGEIVAERAREQIAPQVLRQVPGAEGRAAAEEAVREWTRAHRADYDAARSAAAAALRSELTFRADDGLRYPYLGDYDSYVWLRNARNYLRRGTSCDAVAAGECRDAYGNAPVGYRMRYNRSLHIAAIVAVHKLVSFFHAGYPLEASAFLVPVLVGAAGALPAFFIGRLLAGNVGGLFAALIVSLFPPFLLRSVGGDNDVWNVVLPLYAAWAMIAALKAQKLAAAAGGAVAAGLVTGLHAAVWSGWLFTYGVTLGAALGCLALAAVRQAARGSGRFWRAAEVRRLALLVLVYYFSAGLFVRLAGESSLYVPFEVIASALGFGSRNGGGAGSLWPQALRTVSELGRPRSRDVAEFMGGPLFFFGGWLGLLALALPGEGWRRRHFVLAAWTAAVYAACYYPPVAGDVSRNAVVLLFALPLGVELAVRSLDPKRAARDPGEAAAVFVFLSFFISLYRVYDAVRFLILFAIPFGLAFGAAAGRAREWIERGLRRAAPARAGFAAFAPAASLLLVLPVLWLPLSRGYETVATYYPAMNGAWWDSLVEIRRASRPDAIVNTWWDYGYWVKYAAERRVSSDGGSLQTHVPHWIARALLAPSDAESRGILRMLNCGSDAPAPPEKNAGGFGKLAALGLDEVTAYALLLDLVRLDSADARRYLAARGFTAAEQDGILASTHCAPPESFLVLSREMVLKGEWWMKLGSWDARRAYMVNRTRLLPEREAVADLARRFGYDAEGAARLYRTLAAMRSDADMESFVAPAQSLIPTGWIPCAPADGEMACRITITDGGAARRFYFLYDPADPKSGRLRDERREGGPGVVVAAGRGRLEEVAAADPVFPDIGVLVDAAGGRILIGSPLLVRSTLVRLLYLGDRYGKIFRGLDRRTNLLGEEVASFKINWGE